MTVAEAGVQEPTVCWHPPFEDSRGQEVVELAERCGLVLDPWQRFVLTVGLALDASNAEKWAALEVAAEVSRQNGKGSILEALVLGHLEIFESRLSIWSAHQFDTSFEAFLRLEQLIDGSEELSRKVRRVSRSHGDEGFTMMNGSRVRFRTRTKGGGRGFACDGVLILDEAMVISRMMHGALFPVMSAKPNPQIWYTGSAVDEEVHDQGLVFAALRERGRKAGDPSLVWLEWSADPDIDDPSNVPEEMLLDPDAWARANPALGIRIDPEYVVAERRALDPRTFAVERLGIGAWPNLDASGAALDLEKWAACGDPDSQPAGAVVFAADIAPDRSSGAIAIAGVRQDGLYHLEVVRHLRGTGWMVGDLIRMLGEHPNMGLVLDGAGPGASLMAELDAKGVVYRTVNAREHGSGCGLLFDGVEEARVRHRAQRELTAAIQGAVRRPLGDAWAWSRKSSSIDISPLVACTLALWGSVEGGTAEGGFEW